MSFIESPPFPDAYSYDAVISPGFQTTVQTIRSGHESRVQDWLYDLVSMDLAYQNRGQAERDEITAYFRAARGRLRGFRVRDWSDYQVAQSVGVLAEASGGVFEMFKRYDFNELTAPALRRIEKPRESTIAIFDNGVQMVSGYAIDASAGEVFISAGTGPFSWSGEFDLPMRFDQDELTWQIVDRNQSKGFIYSTASCDLIELRGAE